MQSKTKGNIVYQQIALDANFPISFMDNAVEVSMSKEHNNQITHFHNCVESTYCKKGSLTVCIEGKVVHMKSGDVMLIMPYVTHGICLKPCDVLNQPFSYEYLFFDAGQLIDFVGGVEFARDFPDVSRWHMSYMLLTAQEYPEISRLLPEILEELIKTKNEYSFCACALTLSFLSRIQRRLPEGSKLNSRGVNYIEIKPALNYINQNFSEKIYLNILSELCHMSISNFRLKFKEATGDTPLNYINKLRIQRSCVLLTSTNLSILEISSTVGYDSVSSFNRQFNATIGMSPTKWKETHNKNRK